MKAELDLKDMASTFLSPCCVTMVILSLHDLSISKGLR